MAVVGIGELGLSGTGVAPMAAGVATVVLTAVVEVAAVGETVEMEVARVVATAVAHEVRAVVVAEVVKAALGMMVDAQAEARVEILRGVAPSGVAPSGVALSGVALSGMALSGGVLLEVVAGVGALVALVEATVVRGCQENAVERLAGAMKEGAVMAAAGEARVAAAVMALVRVKAVRAVEAMVLVVVGTVLVAWAREEAAERDRARSKEGLQVVAAEKRVMGSQEAVWRAARRAVVSMVKAKKVAGCTGVALRAARATVGAHGVKVSPVVAVKAAV